MPLDPAISDLLVTSMVGELTSASRESLRLTGMADRNLTQGLGTIQNLLIQAAGGVADDAAVMAALRTAIHIPKPSNGGTS